jgi:hypothetical protein
VYEHPALKVSDRLALRAGEAARDFDARECHSRMVAERSWAVGTPIRTCPSCRSASGLCSETDGQRGSVVYATDR